MEDLSIYGGIILKVIFKKDGVGARGLDGIDVALDRNRWRSFENVVMDSTDCITGTPKWPPANSRPRQGSFGDVTGWWYDVTEMKGKERTVARRE